jgi:hypothetical protein
MIVGCLFTRWVRAGSHWFLGTSYSHKGFYTHLDIAFIVSVAFGTAFTIGLARFGDRRTRALALYCYVPSFAVLLFGALAYIWRWYGG